MPRAKISEFSTTPGDNTDIDGINIAEGCAPSGINDAIRELMAQLKDFQSGAAGDNITVVGTLAAKGTSSSGADLKLYEDTDNGTNYVGFIAPASIASNVQWTLPSADGSSGQALQTNGSGTLSFATLGISAGGTGQTTANAAFNALAPSQTSNAGRYLKTDGTNTSWDLLDISTADITGTLPVANGGTGITSFGTGVATALGINVGSSGAFVTNGGALGTPSSGTVTNLTGTASININGTVGATTPNTGSFTTLTTSSTVTINGGTANGVAYLDGSKVLTTGSALTFNGSDFGVSASVATATLASSGAYSALFFTNSGGAGTSGTILVNSSGILQSRAATHAYTNADASTEYMRLTSTGLGIGTSSPTFGLGTGLQIASAGYAALSLKKGSAGTGHAIDMVDSSNTLQFRIGTNFAGGGNNLLFAYGTTPTIGMTMDTSGNLGLGVTPSAWSSSMRVLQVASTALYNNGFNDTFLGANFYNDTVGTNRYINSDFAAAYGQVGGAHQWYTAPSGTAGNAISFTQAMTLDASGNWMTGTTTAIGRATVVGGSSQLAFHDGNGSNTNYGLLNYGGSSGELTLNANSTGGNTLIRFLTSSGGSNAERARITSDGDFGIGTTSPVSRLEVDTNTAAASTVLSLTNRANWGWDTYLDFRKPLTNGGAVGLAGRISSLFESSNNFALGFSTTGSGTNSERARITSTGALLVGTTDGSQNGGDGNKLIAGGAVWVINAGSNDGFSYYNSSAAAYRFYVSANGTISATNTTISAISDQRLKENVQDLDAGLDKIMALKPRKFDWKTGKGKDIKGDRGFIAQEFEQVFPDLIDEWKDPAPEGEEPYKSVRADLIPVLVKAIQELKSELDSVKAELATLKGN
jgi:hypothetical protein